MGAARESQQNGQESEKSERLFHIIT